ANQPRLIDEAVTQLRRAVVRENTSPEGYRLLAMAYGRKGLTGQASLASAYQYLYQGKLKFAKEQAKRAQTKFREGTPNWVKADDILKFQPPKIR
ncbi:MAG: M48 family peptidase, partial [Methyloligellaceae bacterium]